MSSQKYTLEIAVFTLQGALDAANAGAHRLELCENPAEGGTTPSNGLLISLPIFDIPVLPIIRPRGGHFVYSDLEFKCMLKDIESCNELSYHGIVTGMLTKDGNIHKEQLKQVMKVADGMEVTFHRAFDRCRDQSKALEDIIECGCHRILTSGAYPTVSEGMQNIKALVKQAGDRIIIMPGSGVNHKNLAELIRETGASEYHTAARKSIHDPSVFSPETMQEKLSYTGVDTAEIDKLLQILHAHEAH
ncbi:MAG: copper homeostasis protein CutC [Chitinophagaceae bacterium]|nr:copper homeostasis protein CutC [Chitinophagaceae bacterium]